MSRILWRQRSIFRMVQSQEHLVCRNAPFSTTTIALDADSSPLASEPTTPPQKNVFRYIGKRKPAQGQDSSLRQPSTKDQGLPNTIKSLKGSKVKKLKKGDEAIAAILSKPTWSVRSLLPPETPTQTIDQKQLHHLLRLSALPLPKNAEEEENMLKALHSQLHFVGDIQKVDTEGVEPLVRIAEETEEARREATIGLDDLRDVLDKEVVRGRNRRPKRVRDGGCVGEGEDWDVFKPAGETVEVPGSGRYFVVRSGKGGE